MVHPARTRTDRIVTHGHLSHWSKHTLNSQRGRGPELMNASPSRPGGTRDRRPDRHRCRRRVPAPATRRHGSADHPPWRRLRVALDPSTPPMPRTTSTPTSSKRPTAEREQTVAPLPSRPPAYPNLSGSSGPEHSDRNPQRANVGGQPPRSDRVPRPKRQAAFAAFHIDTRKQRPCQLRKEQRNYIYFDTLQTPTHPPRRGRRGPATRRF